jgi:hypothetical protein
MNIRLSSQYFLFCQLRFIISQISSLSHHMNSIEGQLVYGIGTRFDSALRPGLESLDDCAGQAPLNGVGLEHDEGPLGVGGVSVVATRHRLITRGERLITRGDEIL